MKILIKTYQYNCKNVSLVNAKNTPILNKNIVKII